ncbi:putative arylsulfatase [Alternaria alternata]|nr:putative arylsulfatase [Alternaria alternata]
MIMTDDQDLHLNSLDYQPAVLKHFRDKGTFYSKHFVTMAQCCPSRVSLWTGMAGHNTNVTDIQPPFGGYPKFIQEGLNDRYLPVWLQQAGYNTYYTGKLMNAHGTSTWNKPFPKGWTGSDFLLDPYTYNYNNATLQRNQDPPRSYPGNYSTDLISSKALGFLEDAASSDAPFFLGVMPIGPHAETVQPASPGALPTFNPPVPALRHKDLYQGVKVPRTDNFNPNKTSGASFIAKLPQQNSTVVEYNDEYYRLRLATLAAVDDLVDAMFERLEAMGLLDNTYVIYTSDNGYHIGQHRLPPGKACAIEEDIGVPMFIRGPGVPEGATVDSPTTHTDIVPTLFSLARIPLLKQFDGIPMPITEKDYANARHEHVNIEFWGENLDEGMYGSPVPRANNTYKSLRVVANDYDLSYTTDPSQMNNLWNTNGTSNDLDIQRLWPRLDALLMVTKSCKGEACTKPWPLIHPRGDVQSLREAMNPDFDEFYADQHKIKYDACALGYFPSLEGPQHVLPYVDDTYSYMQGSHWSDWT